MILNVNKSYFLVTVVSVAHVGSIVILLILPLLWLYQAVAIALVSVSLIQLRRRGDLSAQGQWRIRNDGTCIGPSMHVSPESVSWRIVEAIRYPGWVCLRLVTKERRTRLLLIMRDAVDPHTYRELCARIEQHRLSVPDQSPV